MTRSNYNYDVLYIGSGHGTFDGAIPLGKAGMKVGVVEENLVGGTCPNRGCNAKIILDTPVELMRHLEAAHGIKSSDITLNWSDNKANKQRIIDGLPNFIQGLLEDAGIDLIVGHGRLVDAHTVDVNGEQKTAEKIVIATGLRPNRLDIPGTRLLHDSEDFMNLETIPKRIVVIGGGYVAMEMATMANAAGAQVTVVLRHDQILRAYYQPFAQNIRHDLEKRGVVFLDNTTITSVTETIDGIVLATDQNTSITADWGLDATGRIPNIENIGLEAVGVQVNTSGIPVNGYLQTNVPSIYASGDVIDKDQPKLTPTAIFESTYLTELFLDQTTLEINYPVIPSTVFTSPRLAQVGVTIDQAKAHPDQYVIQTNHLADDWFRQIETHDLGENILIFDQDHHLVGATELSEEAVETINLLLPLIEFGYGPAEMKRLVPLFPSIGFSTWDQV